MRFARFAVLSTLALMSATTTLCKSHGQAIPTASKGAEISAFGGYAVAKTDYGPSARKGISAGVDFTIFPRFAVAPSLEVRAQDVVAQDVTEKAVLVGLRVQKDFRDKLHPYVDFLIGGSEIVYHIQPYPDYTSDKSKAYSFGGGINIDIMRHFGLKMDVQRQNLNFGSNYALQPTGNYTLTPTTAMVGVTYTVPFRTLNRHGDFSVAR
jgi:hypothetical protein